METAEKKVRGLSGTELKYIAILAMFIDHAAQLFVPQRTALYVVMRLVGRITAPLMCFFISEGYHHTRNVKKYIGRLAVFAVISHPAFNYCFNGRLFSLHSSSVITTLLLALLTVCVLNSETVPRAYKLPIILLLMYVSRGCDWGYTAILFTLAFELGHGSGKRQIIGYSASAFTIMCIDCFKVLAKAPEFFTSKIPSFGVLIPALLLLAYNGERGGGKASKWVFYVFYPVHLFVLGYIYNKYC